MENVSTMALYGRASSVQQYHRRPNERCPLMYQGTDSMAGRRGKLGTAPTTASPVCRGTTMAVLRTRAPIDCFAELTRATPMQVKHSHILSATTVLLVVAQRGSISWPLHEHTNASNIMEALKVYGAVRSPCP